MCTNVCVNMRGSKITLHRLSLPCPVIATHWLGTLGACCLLWYGVLSEEAAFILAISTWECPPLRSHRARGMRLEHSRPGAVTTSSRAHLHTGTSSFLVLRAVAPMSMPRPAVPASSSAELAPSTDVVKLGGQSHGQLRKVTLQNDVRSSGHGVPLMPKPWLLCPLLPRHSCRAPLICLRHREQVPREKVGLK